MGAWSSVENQGDWEQLDSQGSDLSAILNCPVRFCGQIYGKNIFECRHSIVFPRFAVLGAQQTGDWSQIMEHHKQSLEGMVESNG